MFTRHARIMVALLCAWMLMWGANLPAQNQWERVGVPETSALDVRALVVDSSGTLYAGAYGGGVWRSADGDRWTSFSAGLTDLYVTRMIVTPNGKTLFAATASNRSLYRYRLDSGGSWELVSVSFQKDRPVTGLTADSSGQIFATNSSFDYNSFDQPYVYIYRSQDNGTSWTMVTTMGYDFIVNLYVTPADVLIADWQQLDQAGLERSLDGGQSWQNCWLDHGPYYGSWSNHAVTQSFGVNVNTGSVFVGFYNFNGNGLNLARTTDTSAATWTALPQVGASIQISESSYTSPPPLTAIASRPWGDMFVGLGMPYNNSSLYPEGQGVWRSIDDGQSFTDVSLGLENKNVNALVATLDGRIYAGTAAGIFRSTDLVSVELSKFSVE